MYYLTVAMGQESRRGLAGSSGSGLLTRLLSRRGQGLQLSSGEESVSKRTHLVVGGNRFSRGCWAEGWLAPVRLLAAALSSLPCGSLRWFSLLQ